MNDTVQSDLPEVTVSPRQQTISNKLSKIGEDLNNSQDSFNTIDTL